MFDKIQEILPSSLIYFALNPLHIVVDVASNVVDTDHEWFPRWNENLFHDQQEK